MARETGDAVQVELAQEIGAKAFNCLCAFAKPRRDLFDAMALGDELQDLALAVREEIGGTTGTRVG